MLHKQEEQNNHDDDDHDDTTSSSSSSVSLHAGTATPYSSSSSSTFHNKIKINSTTSINTQQRNHPHHSHHTHSHPHRHPHSHHNHKQTHTQTHTHNLHHSASTNMVSAQNTHRRHNQPSSALAAMEASRVSSSSSPLPTSSLSASLPVPIPLPNPADADHVLSLLRLRKLQYMQTFIVSDSIPALILPNLYLGSVGAAKNKHFLHEHGITHILTIGNNLPIFHADEFEYLHLVVQDGEKEDITKHFDRCLRFVERGRGGQGEISGNTANKQTHTETHTHRHTARLNHMQNQTQTQTTCSEYMEDTKDPDSVLNGNNGGVVSSSVSLPLSVSNLLNEEKRREYDIHTGEGCSLGTGVLLHCFAGRSRSVTILLAYLLTLVHRNPPTHPDITLMTQALDNLPGSTTPSSSNSSLNHHQSSSSLSLQQLFDYVKSKRPEIKPNAGFVAQLLILEKELIQMQQQFESMNLQVEGDEQVALSPPSMSVLDMGEQVTQSVVTKMSGKERGEEWRQF